LDEVTEEQGPRRKFRVVDVAVQGLVQSKYELGHVVFLPFAPSIRSGASDRH
jgi:hypothetical protein